MIKVVFDRGENILEKDKKKKSGLPAFSFFFFFQNVFKKSFFSRRIVNIRDCVLTPKVPHTKIIASADSVDQDQAAQKVQPDL